jgi:hypothetical protein
LILPYDQKTQVGQISVVLAEEKPEDREAAEPRHIQHGSSRQKTRKSGAVLQTALKFAPRASPSSIPNCGGSTCREALKKTGETGKPEVCFLQ